MIILRRQWEFEAGTALLNRERNLNFKVAVKEHERGEVGKEESREGEGGRGEKQRRKRD
jgi:hypothetical protein